MYSQDEEQEFIEGLYDYAEEEIKEVSSKEEQEEILQKVAMILLTYTIVDNILDLNRKDKVYIYSTFKKLFKENLTETINNQSTKITSILDYVSKNTNNFYGGSASEEELEEILDTPYKGEKYSTRVENNAKEIYKKLQFVIYGFLCGKIDANDIKNEILKIYKFKDYAFKRLVETELSRVEKETFLFNSKEKLLTRNAILDGQACEHCASLHGKIYTVEEAENEEFHPKCRCYFTEFEEVPKL